MLISFKLFQLHCNFCYPYPSFHLPHNESTCRRRIEFQFQLESNTDMNLLSIVRGSVTNNNGFWIGRLDFFYTSFNCN
jgi:hypothetical protein